MSYCEPFLKHQTRHPSSGLRSWDYIESCIHPVRNTDGRSNKHHFGTTLGVPLRHLPQIWHPNINHHVPDTNQAPRLPAPSKERRRQGPKRSQYSVQDTLGVRPQPDLGGSLTKRPEQQTDIEARLRLATEQPKLNTAGRWEIVGLNG